MTIRFRVWQNLMQRVKLNLHARGRPVVGASDKQNFVWNLYTGYQTILYARVFYHAATLSLHWIARKHILYNTSPDPVPQLPTKLAERGESKFCEFWVNQFVSWRLLFVDGPASIPVTTAFNGSATLRYTLPPKQRRPQRRTSRPHMTDSTLPFQSWRVSCHGQPIEVFSGSDHHAKIATSNIQITLMNGTVSRG